MHANQGAEAWIEKGMVKTARAKWWEGKRVMSISYYGGKMLNAVTGSKYILFSIGYLPNGTKAHGKMSSRITALKHAQLADKGAWDAEFFCGQQT